MNEDKTILVYIIECKNKSLGCIYNLNDLPNLLEDTLKDFNQSHDHFVDYTIRVHKMNVNNYLIVNDKLSNKQIIEICQEFNLDETKYLK